jgi:hypothetical protein
MHQTLIFDRWRRYRSVAQEKPTCLIIAGRICNRHEISVICVPFVQSIVCSITERDNGYCPPANILTSRLRYSRPSKNDFTGTRSSLPCARVSSIARPDVP